MTTGQNKSRYKNKKLNVRQKRSDFSRPAIRSVFDLGIKACDEKDTLTIYNVINTLKGMISCQYKGVASGYFRLYDHCLQFVKDKRFDKAGNILPAIYYMNSIKVGM